MSDIVKVLPYSVDLDRPVEKTLLPTLFATEDNRAHRFELALHNGGAAVDLAGAGVTGYFIRYADRLTIPIAGSVEGGKAVLTLNESCYALAGRFALTIKITLGDVRAAVFHGEGGMTRSRTDSILDDENVIPSLDELLAQIATIEDAVSNANDAADAANAAASRTAYIDEATNHWMTWDAETGGYVDSGVSAVGPQGPQGETGKNGDGAGTVTGVTVNGETYEPDDTGVVNLGELGGGGSGSVTGVKVNDTTYDPDDTGVVDLGTLGSGSVTGVMVNGETKQPDSTGVVDLGELSSGSGSVTGVKLNDTTYEPDEAGVVDLGTLEPEDITGLTDLLDGKVDASMMQSGVVSVSLAAGTNTTKAVTFPTAMSGAPSVLMTSVYTNLPSNYYAGAYSATGAGFTAYVYNTATSGTTTIRFYWLAIWK